MEASQPSDADEPDQQRPPMVPSYLDCAAQPQAMDTAQPDTTEQCLPIPLSSGQEPADGDVQTDDPKLDEVADGAWLDMQMEDAATYLPDKQPSYVQADRMQEAEAAQPEGDSVRRRPHVPALQLRRRACVLHEDEQPEPCSPVTAVPSGDSLLLAHGLHTMD